VLVLRFAYGSAMPKREQEVARELADARQRFARFPPDFTLKGMFFSRLLTLGGADARAVWPELLAAPRLGRYLPFSDYPQVDFSRIAFAAAISRFPSVPATEAMRRLGRLDYETFASSTLGRVKIAMSADAGAALESLPGDFRAVMRGGSVRTQRLSPSEFELHFDDFYGWLDCYPAGQIEGVVAHHGVQCEVQVTLRSPVSGVYRVKLNRDPSAPTRKPSSPSSSSF
jgi:uncharacterized protein (TIGR02265 family)